LLKTSIGLLLGWLAAAIFGLDGVERIAVIVASSLPPSMLTLVFAEENKLDTNYVANLLSTALPVALLFFPVLLNFL
jgi:predicted permease